MRYILKRVLLLLPLVAFVAGCGGGGGGGGGGGTSTCVWGSSNWGNCTWSG